MEEGNRRHQRTLNEWTSGAIRSAASTETRPDGRHVTHAQRQYSRVRILDAQRQLATLDHLVGRAVWVALMATFLAAVLLMLLRTVDFIPASAVTVALIWAATISLAVYRHRVAMVAKSSPYSQILLSR